MSPWGLILTLLLMLLFAAATRPTHANGSIETWPEMVPATDRVEMLMMNETRRRLGSFRICALCTCCGGAKGLCLPSPCCYAINCNIPNRPFGFCSFTPKTCNCFGCHL